MLTSRGKIEGRASVVRAAGFLLEVWLLDAETELRRRLVARRNQVVRHRTQIKKGIPFFRRILSRRAHMPTCSAGRVGTGSDDRNCQPMSGPQSTGFARARSAG